MNEKSIGLIELTSVAAGFEAADVMLKAGSVQLILARSICSGKYMVLIGGSETAAVQSAVDAGCAAAGGCVIDHFVIPNVHPEVFAAIGRSQVGQTPFRSSSSYSSSFALSEPHSAASELACLRTDASSALI